MDSPPVVADCALTRTGDQIAIRYASAGVERELRLPCAAWAGLAAAVRAGTLDALDDRWVRWTGRNAVGFAALRGGQLHLIHGDQYPREYRLPASAWEAVTAAARGTESDPLMAAGVQ
ncbi:hypothetical protein FF36_05599 [Frankia torreyi]|uniref:Uncharacterized protein n=1 Tax=Frankia torreyi TaxID=1856 RepID=A0A0D8B738_9ACTN|nr:MULTISPECIES: hypothetical protein [Frankia]KJE20108.1 hypothetical protein FF36_05599 [Frankia torreyi]KQM02388.1 hypothetical protein FF86_106919 [Frankia sp. CpI1-P]